MNSPARWLESSDAPLGAQQLLSAATVAPPFTDAIRYRLSLGIAKTAALPVATAWSVLVAKSALVVGVAGGGGLMLHAASAPQEASPADHNAPAPAVQAPAVAAPAVVEQPAPASPEVSLPALEKAPSLKLDPRVAEAELLEKARSLLAASPAAALKLTAQHGREFPKGRLGAEADLIAAQALLGLGNSEAARQRAEASLRRYPSGIYAGKLRQIAESKP